MPLPHLATNPNRDNVVAAPVTRVGGGELGKCREKLGSHQLNLADTVFDVGRYAVEHIAALKLVGTFAHACRDAVLRVGEMTEHGVELTRGDRTRELAARLALDTVCLVDDPVPDGRQDAIVGLHVTEQQRMVGDDDVGAGGSATRPVKEAASPGNTGSVS